MSTEHVAFIFLLCKQPIPLLGPLRDAVTIEMEEVVGVLSKQWFTFIFIGSQGLPWSPA